MGMWYVFTQNLASESSWYRNISIGDDTEEKAVKIYKEFLNKNLLPYDKENLSVREDEYGHDSVVDMDKFDFEDDEE